MTLLLITDDLVSSNFFKLVMVAIILLWYLDFTGYIQKSNVTLFKCQYLQYAKGENRCQL